MNNKVELIGTYGDDTTHACSAWTSTSRDLTPTKRNKMGALLEMLASQGHHTPFEKRYKELKENKSYLPSDWKGIKVSNSSGRSCYEDFTFAAENEEWSDVLQRYTELGNDLYHKCVKDLEPSLGRKRAKESARFFKTYNSQIQADVMFNFRSFYHFLNLRNKPDAQLEIRELSENMLQLVKDTDKFPLTIKAFKL